MGVLMTVSGDDIDGGGDDGDGESHSYFPQA